ncbi:chemotaxis protein CheW [Thiorhodococcus minor]|uniref:Chemotaxis protein CheW n=1 Tax=Thiorhodococcus minor TaxID=57489 RepID=A0A6M0JWK4_9GAMM|nr:chemotaxis protein CheW [Thiorhodococcus minor]NEV61331.1 chemotaxis protein CheW [Thiorhodococcus minor]
MSEISLEGTAIASYSRREPLTFDLGEQECAIDILEVQEIRGYDAVTKIANSPELIRGVNNMRGVIILNIAGRVAGIVVDGVSDVIALSDSQISPAPGLGAVLDTDDIDGLANLDERMIIMVDIEKLMTSGEMGLVEQVQTAAA